VALFFRWLIKLLIKYLNGKEVSKMAEQKSCGCGCGCGLEKDKAEVAKPQQQAEKPKEK
jgi:hypothetical protein